jgi:hypothetical protein
LSESQIAADVSKAAAVKWRVCPASKSALKTVLALSVVAALGWATYLASESRFAGVAAAIGVVLVLHRYFFPSTHIVDDAGITVRTLLGTRSLPWEQVNHVSHDATRVYISPRARRGSDGGRGLLLLLKNNQAEVLAAIAARRQARNSPPLPDEDRNPPLP